MECQKGYERSIELNVGKLLHQKDIELPAGTEGGKDGIVSVRIYQAEAIIDSDLSGLYVKTQVRESANRDSETEPK